MKKNHWGKLGLFIFLQCTAAVLALEKISFDDSMQTPPFVDYHYAPQDERWKLCRTLYEGYQPEPDPQGDYIIPNIVHLIWLGSPLPERCVEMVDSWEKFHPEWTVKVWTDADCNDFHLTNQLAFERATNYGEKADIWRYEILYRYGGLYVDTDFECLKPFDSLHKTCEFYAGMTLNPECQLLNGLIGSARGHPILKACIENIQVGPGDNNPDRIMNDTGPYHLTRMFIAYTSLSDVGKIVTFPVSVFYPFPPDQRHRKEREEIKQQYVRPESFAIHYWATSWTK
jgi:inositol phosphorylceramide mannosyltransferase catalytic subunit